MDADENVGDVFRIPNLYGVPKSILATENIAAIVPEAVAHLHEEHDFFSISGLSLASKHDLPPRTHTETSLDEISEDSNSEAQQLDEDIWTLEDSEPLDKPRYQSWDSFIGKESSKPGTPYISEAGLAIFDSALGSSEDHLKVHNGQHMVVNCRFYASSILALGLGRSSVFFEWSEEKRDFEQTLLNIRISGYSGQSLDRLSAVFKQCGKAMRTLQDFVDKTYAKETLPGRVALADAVSTLLSTIQTRLSSSTSAYNSLIHLESLFLPVRTVLKCFQDIVQKVSAASSDEEMLSIIFQEVQLLEHRTDSLKDILLRVLSRVSQPWLEFCGEWLGLQREAGLPLTKDGRAKGFVKIEDKEWVDDQGFELQESDFALDYDLIPKFVTSDDARSMFEVGRSLRFLRDHHSQHPLAKADIVATASPPTLEWKFSWQEILQVEAKALQYEKDLASAIREYSTEDARFTSVSCENFDTSESFELDFLRKPAEYLEAHILASMDVFDGPLPKTQLPDELAEMLDAYLSSKGDTTEDDSIFAPPISLTPVLSFNAIIAAQARIMNGVCMRLFFRSHDLRNHLSLQRNFHLLGNGVFSSRLSHALFDPDLESAERQRGVARSGGVMGLRLGGRDTWPPASSELRLALMGVLTESYVSTRPIDRSEGEEYTDRPASLPGDLSFAVRDMSAEEIDACMNPDSVEALDFLRLSYKPPAPLEAIITPIILYKYDQLFKLLLRVLRMLYVVSSLFRDAKDKASNARAVSCIQQRFRIEAHHFISSVAGYFFDTGIEATWRIFERKLDQVEERIRDDKDLSLGQNEGLDKLRDYHESVLDRIMFALLLRKRQQPVMRLLEEIFTLVLQFAKHSRDTAAPAVEEDIKIREIYTRFHKKVGVFVAVCRSLSEKKGYAEKSTGTFYTKRQGSLLDGHDLQEENTIAQLLTRLEMSNFYSTAAKV
ncbi:spindle pole body component-4 [Coleophoma crateriformis]|uniref:Spindle pole body component n=1 Tax=Coleophoma crateriformis TaxID=565419 RepID=A0A3D8T0M9_9HELO|nr:spindle pole body component-4 [Coleophoma crateriformis]